jgi:hypothetical protein
MSPEANEKMDQDCPSLPAQLPILIFPGLWKLSDLESSRLSTVKKNSEYNHYGRFDSKILAREAANFVATNSDADRDATAAVIRTFLEFAEDDSLNMAPEPEKRRLTQACWLTVRMTKPEEDYRVPRWHQDRRMFECTCKEPRVLHLHCKYAMVLLGPTTRVLEWTDDVSQFMETLGSTSFLEIRRELADRFQDAVEEPIPEGGVVRFSWGLDNSPVHSEPDCSNSDRVFISLLFDNEDEIKCMCGWRKVKWKEPITICTQEVRST